MSYMERSLRYKVCLLHSIPFHSILGYVIKKIRNWFFILYNRVHPDSNASIRLKHLNRQYGTNTNRAGILLISSYANEIPDINRFEANMHINIDKICRKELSSQCVYERIAFQQQTLHNRYDAEIYMAIPKLWIYGCVVVVVGTHKVK